MSRRDTTGSRAGAPDWTNQARLVTRAKDIAINRDLERGDGGRRGIPLEKSDAITEGITVPASTATHGDQDDGRDQFPPDGKHNQTREWKEGDQRVVKRNMGGPGDDVSFYPFFSCFI